LIVYKFQINYYYNEDNWMSPVCGHSPEYNKVLTAKFDDDIEDDIDDDIEDMGNAEEVFDRFGCADFESGYFHSYFEIPSAGTWMYNRAARVIECVIPAGETIYFNKQKKEIVSRKLIFTEKEVARWEKKLNNSMCLIQAEINKLKKKQQKAR